MKRFLATLLLAAATTVQADPVLLEDVNTGIRIPTEAPVQMGAYWYFNSCNDGIGCELWRTDGTGPGTSLVADIRTGSRGSNPTALTVIADTLYFAADDGTHGAELWKSDGTAQGTTLVRDIVPGSQDSGPESLVEAGGQLFFTAAVPGTGRELWKSDGTAGGTLLVKDINPGEDWSDIQALLANGSLVVFVASDGISGWEPWRSDGTPEGTFQLKDVTPGSDSSQLLRLAVAGPHAFFSTVSGPLPGTYATDGTVDGTIRVGPAATQEPFAVSGSRVFFLGSEESTGQELWVSDGSPAGTRLVMDIMPGPESGRIARITPLGSGVVFSANDGATGNEPWFSDGTAAGTVLLANLFWDGIPSIGPTQFTTLGTSALFVASSTDHGSSVWATDGSPAGTRLVKDIVPGADGAFLTVLGKAGSFVYLHAEDGVHGRELWRTDGTTAGTVMVTEHTAGPSTHGGDSAFLGAHPVGSRLIYATITPQNAAFVTDGSPGPAVPLAPAAPQPTGSSPCFGESVSVGRLVYFIAYDPLHGCELWRTDGTPPGTFPVKDIRPGPGGSMPWRLTAANGWLYFAAQDGEHFGPAVWRTNGTEEGTVRVETGGAWSEFVVLGNAVYFLGETLPWAYVEPWRTAIGSSEAQPVSSLVPGLALKSSTSLVSSGEMAFFVADDFVHGQELWRTDGTSAGTRLVKDLTPGSGSSLIGGIHAAAGKAFFRGPDGMLWTSDGTDSGTIPVVDTDGISLPYPTHLASTPSHMLLFEGAELWRTNGTPAGTYRLASTLYGFEPFATAGPLVYLLTSGATGSPQLWCSDGTSVGTALVKEFIDEFPHLEYGVAPFGQRLYFHTQDSLGVLSTYRTEGTAASTVKLFSAPAPDPFNTGSLASAGSVAGLFIFHNDAIAGQEPSFLASEPGLDADGDGIPDLRELDLGRDPEKKDNDIFSPGPGAATLFAMQQYRDFLAREGDVGGIDYWAGQVVSGARSRAQVVDFFFASPEFQGVIAPVARLYFAYFRRIPDYDGLQFWIGRFRAGDTLDSISGLFAGSPEFGTIYGGLDNAAFVSLVYGNILGRVPDAEGFAFWKGRLDSGATTRGQLMVAFSESPEYRAFTHNEVYVTMMYTGMLRRSPDPGGFAFWVSYLDAGNSGLALIDGFLASFEYRGRFLPN